MCTTCMHALLSGLWCLSLIIDVHALSLCCKKHIKDETIQKCTTLSGNQHRGTYTPLHMYCTYTTTISNRAPLSAGIQLCLLTDKQGSPPFAHHYWSHPLLIRWLLVRWLLYSYTVTHTVETQQPEKLLCLLGYSSVYWLISRVLHYCNTVTGHAPYSYKLYIRLRLYLGLGWCHLPIGWFWFQFHILKIGMQTFQLHLDIVIWWTWFTVSN